MNVRQISSLFQKLSDLGLDPVIYKNDAFNDEPQFFSYNTGFVLNKKYTDGYVTESRVMGSGTSFFDSENALSKSIFEAMERFSSQCYRRKSIKYASFSKNKSNFLDPTLFLASKSIQNSVLGWVKGVDYIKNKPIYIPAQLAFYNYLNKKNEPYLPYPKNSTGAAAGSSPEHAILNGIYEVIERDAFVTCYLNRISPAQIKLSEINRKDISHAIKLCEKYHLRLTVLDITNDIQIPVFMAILTDTLGGPPIAIGCKSGFRAYEAIMGAIMESFMIRNYTKSMMQGGTIFGEKSNEGDIFVERARYWLFPGMTKKLDFLFTGKEIKPFYKVFKGNLKKELKEVVKILEKKNLNVCTLDNTIKEFRSENLFVYQVLIPHLQPLYLHESEREQSTNIERLKEVAKFFGKKYAGPNKIPHPFL